MNFWEELEDCKYSENELLVDHLVEVVKDEGINSLEELKKYEQRYFVESNMSRLDFINWYENSFAYMPELESLGEEAKIKINALREELKNANDTNIKIKNIILICTMMEREFCFLVEAYNLIVNGDVAEQVEEVSVIEPVKKSIVLCGSISAKDDMLRVSEILKTYGIHAILPEEVENGEVKAIASRANMDRVVNPENHNILIINSPKNGIPNYIGANVLAEVALGFYHKKNVFLLNGIYEPFKDELIGWGVTCLNGNLANIVNLI